MAADVPPLSFVVGSLWPVTTSTTLRASSLPRPGMTEGFAVKDLPLPKDRSHWNRQGHGWPLHFGCGFGTKDAAEPLPTCTYCVLFEPRVVDRILRTMVTRANTQHNHESRIEVRDKALSRLDHIRKSSWFRVTSVDPPTRWELDAAFGEQNMILNMWEKMFGKESSDELVEAAKENSSLSRQDEPERKEPRIGDEQAKAPQTMKKKVAVIDSCNSESEDEDVRPTINITPAIPAETAKSQDRPQDCPAPVKDDGRRRRELTDDLADFLRSFSSPEQLWYIASRENGALDGLLEELGTDIIRLDGTAEKGMPRVWRSALRDELKLVAGDG
ncbi:hypothetical protein JCM10295v2_003961 [Rhodotorula toruloides]